MQSMSSEGLTGTPFEQAYLQLAPNPDDWPVLLSKLGDLSRTFAGWAEDDLSAITAPVLVMLGDADAVYLEHAIRLIQLLGGDVNGDFAGVPASQLAVLPGTTHFSALSRPDLLASLINPFLDA